MKILDKVVGFEWDDSNRAKNYEKHKVSWTECEEAFFNEPLYIYYDKKHSKAEDRYYMFGSTNSARLLFIVFTVRENKIRVISARDMNKKERKVYREKIKENTKI